ncbi:GMC oxidoreductase [Streptomyces sp. NPDC002574]|uniref:GMC oxidoreductase n=1 Tax=Streptomyces sp. NPDC002574 TaxID=3364652 RepID=UPI00369BEF40
MTRGGPCGCGPGVLPAACPGPGGPACALAWAWARHHLPTPGLVPPLPSRATRRGRHSPEGTHRDPHAPAFARDAAMPYPHPVGTRAVGSVVDAELRVHGVEGRRIADASVCPGSSARARTRPPS